MDAHEMDAPHNPCAGLTAEINATCSNYVKKKTERRTAVLSKVITKIVHVVVPGSAMLEQPIAKMVTLLGSTIIAACLSRL